MRTPMWDVGTPDTGRAAPDGQPRLALDHPAHGGLRFQLWSSSSRPA